MADRFYINTTNLVTFSAGERPTADKFNAVNKYFSRGLNSLARVIGDAHDDGAPHNLNTSIYLTNKWNRSGVDNERPLDILNLARIIGPASNLNPKYLNRSDHASRMVQETIPAGVLEYYPKFPISSLGTTIPNSEFVVDKGFIRFNSNTVEEIQFEYVVKGAELIEGGPNYIDAEFNVIPDPNTPSNDLTFKLDIAELTDGTYHITLPTVGFQQSKLSNLNDSNIDASEPNNAAQLKLPKWIQDLGVNYNGEVLPQGTIFLKDRTTGESFIDAHYIYISDTEIRVDRVELCLDEDHDFCLVMVGTDITTTLDDLRNKTFLHKHDGSFGESRISIYDLKDVFKYAPPSGAYRESELNWNAFPQYLHRDGWQVNQDSFNGENAMRGSLMMGLTGVNNISHPVYFGEVNKQIKSSGNRLLIQSSSDENSTDRGVTILATGTETNEIGIEVNSSTNTVIAATQKVNNNNCQNYYYSNNNAINQDNIFSDKDKMIIENAGSFEKEVLEDQHLLFNISLEDLENLLGITIDFTADGLHGFVSNQSGGEWKVISKATNQDIVLDINFFKNIDSSNIKDLYTYTVDGESQEIDFLSYGKSPSTLEKVLLSLSSKNPNAKYRLDLRNKVYNVDINSITYNYYVNLFHKINIISTNPIQLQQVYEDGYIIIDRFKNYYNLIETDTCNYKSTFEIFLQTDINPGSFLYLFFNYNGHINNDEEYLGPFSGYENGTDNANKKLVEKIFIEVEGNHSGTVNINNNGINDNNFSYLRINNSSNSNKIKLICKEYFDHNLKQINLEIKTIQDTSSNKNYSRPLI